MLCPFVPGCWPFETTRAAGFRAVGSLRWVPSLYKTTQLHILDIVVPIRLLRIVTLGESPFDLWGCMHATKVLRKQILSVKLVAFAVSRGARADRAAVKLQAQVLRGNVSLPFILGPKRARAAAKMESAWKRSGVRRGNVFAQRGRIFKRRVGAVGTAYVGFA